MNAVRFEANGRFSPLNLSSLTANDPSVQAASANTDAGGLHLIGCNSASLLDHASYYKVTFRRATWELADAGWRDSMDQVFGGIASTKMAFPVSSPGYTGDEKSTAVMLKPSLQKTTVAQLVRALNDLSPGLVLKEVTVYSVERVTDSKLATGDAGAASLDASSLKASQAIDQEGQNGIVATVERNVTSFFDRVKSLGTVVYWSVLALIVLVALYLLWSVTQRGVAKTAAGIV